MQPLKEDFKIMLQELLGHEAETLIDALDTPPVTSIRLNKRKKVEGIPQGLPVAWCQSGFYLSQRPDFILDPLLHAGAYYVQDASSMIYETLVAALLKNFTDNSIPTLNVLDLCAAPGGKTTAMINALPDGSEITANEYTRKRVEALKENLDRWGYPHVKVTNKASSFFALQGENYDIVAVDAPCSGEGMMRKEEIARTQWSPQLVEQCSTLQKDILRNAVQALKPGGFLIYSTCTFNRKENEENAEFVKESLGLIPFDPLFSPDWGIARGIDSDLPVYRFMPHVTKGEGLFLAVFRKPGDWAPSKAKTGNYLKCKEEDFPCVDVDKPTAISYLRGEAIVLPPDSPRGLVTITYKGLPLGTAKNIGSRANNLYPKNRRILKR